MTNAQTGHVLEIWSQLFESHDGSWSELAMKVVEEYTKPHNELAAAVVEALPLLKHYENQLASSLSCDSRSHDQDREPRQQLTAIIESVSRLGIGKPTKYE